MFNRRAAGLLGAVVLLAVACGGGGSSPAPATQPATASQPAGSAAAGECKVGVSWNNFTQPRWAAHDKPNIQSTLAAGGATYTDADAGDSTTQQLTDVDTLLSQGIKVLILLAKDNKAVLPALQKAQQANVPVIAYDRLIEDPSVFYLTFDNQGVGQAEAEAIMAKVPEGNYVLIKGDPGDPNASTFLPLGWDAAGLKAAVDAGKITILNASGTNWPADYGTYTPDWKTQTAQDNMEAIIDKAKSDNKTIDAILAENDSTALGVAAALNNKSYGFPPLSGQDGDTANLNNVALGKQYVDVWKNANELGKAAGAIALQLCAGKSMADVTIPDGVLGADVVPTAGLKATMFTTPGNDGKPGSGDENQVNSIILKPQPLTADKLQQPIDAGYITKDQLCAGVDASAATAPAACK